MWISYSDSEVNVYHPICEKALNRALILLHKEQEYRVIHHQHTGSLEMDFVIQNISTGKYFVSLKLKEPLQMYIVLDINFKLCLMFK